MKHAGRLCYAIEARYGVSPMAFFDLSHALALRPKPPGLLPQTLPTIQALPRDGNQAKAARSHLPQPDELVL
jgi:hypothetical protein